MRGHDEMRQHRLRRLGGTRSPQRCAISRAMPSGPSVARMSSCAAPRGLGAAIGQVDDVALPQPSIAACGSSTKLFSPSESQ